MEENRIYNSHNVALVVKNPPIQKAQEMRFQSLGWEDLGKEMPTHFSILAGEISWTEKPGALEPMRS